MNTNKKSVIMLSLIFTAALLTSCSKEDNKNKVPMIEGIVTDTYQAPSPEDKSTDTYNKPMINSASDKSVINNTSINGSYTEYIVKKSDTLYSICKTFEKTCPIPVAVKTILSINNLTEADGLQDGMTLKLPSDYFNHGKIYTIKKGDTLYSISRQIFQNQSPAASAYKIAKDNFLTNLEEINIGDQLFIAYN
jgi:LysM repeat protein